MLIFLEDIQKWILVTKEEARSILNAQLDKLTKLTIQPYLIY